MFVTKRQAADAIVDLFRDENVGTIEVRDDALFAGNSWLTVGKIGLRVPLSGVRAELAGTAFLLGGYEITIDSAAAISKGIKECRGGTEALDDVELKNALEAVAYMLRRTALLPFPFDSASSSQMPFREPTTVVFDTTAVIQGALNHLIRMQWGASRVKIPAIVHMEILNLNERYMKRRRSKPNSKRFGSAVQEHAHAFGAQRALLQLGVNAETDIERSRLGADPLRGVVQPDSDGEDKQLGLSHTQRSFADRLILETALQNQRERYSMSQAVRLVTSDQGLARMSIAEGLGVIFFQAASAMKAFGKTVHGRRFDPFGTVQEAIPLADVLWEFAVSFGSVKIRTSAGDVIITAIGDTMLWEPSQVSDDLLFLTCNPATKLGVASPLVVRKGDTAVNNAQIASKGAKIGGNLENLGKPHAPRALKGAYKVRLIPAYAIAKLLSEKKRVTADQAERSLDLGVRGFREYANAFSLMGIADHQGTELSSTNDTSRFVGAYRATDIATLKRFYIRVASFDDFLRAHSTVGTRYGRVELEGSSSAGEAYLALAEALEFGLILGGDFYVPTPNVPELSEFVELAIETYNTLANSDGLALVGAWLEMMAQRFGIHPAVSKQSLQQASDRGMLRRFVEGSSPDRRYARHNLRVLTLDERGTPMLTRINLYYGTYLTTGMASVALRILRAS